MEIPVREPRESASDYALRVIWDNITTLKLLPGTIIGENALGKELELSRTPVREALQQLSKFDLVNIYPQKGCSVALIDMDIVDEAVFLRRILEKAVVQELCESITPVQLQKLQQNIDLQEFYLERGDRDKIFELDNEFHYTLYEFANKVRVYHLMKNMNGHFDRVRVMSVYSVKDIKIISDHKAILNAIKSGEKDLAAEFVEKHLSRYKLDQAELMAEHPEYFKKNNR